MWKAELYKNKTNNLFKNFYKYTRKVNFFKKFTISIVNNKRIARFKPRICNLSCKHRYVIPKLNFKRHTFKSLLTHNEIPNIIKKNK